MSGSFYRLDAPAKVNLFLEVLERRDDGFHEIETVMATIGLWDTLQFHVTEGPEVRLQCDWALGLKNRASFADREKQQTIWGDLPAENDNLGYRAAELLRQAGEVTAGADITLIKRVPSAAGLGGASSDAAAVLRSANTAWGLHWPIDRLLPLAAQLGSDVPFFLQGGAQLCQGRGERTSAIQTPKLHLVVVRPAFGLSTAEVYRQCAVPGRPQSITPLLDAARNGHAAGVARNMMNRLMEAAEEVSSFVGKLRRELAELDCLGALMSGSGSSFFALCRHARHARRVASQLAARGWQGVWPTTTLGAPCPLRIIRP